MVGNEVLLRGEMTTADLAATIRSVKAQVTVPVTYADVWEYWLRYREIYEAVDFVTIHILPYWEDFPIRAKFAADPCQPDPPTHGGGVSRQGNPDRRDRLAERRAGCAKARCRHVPIRRGWFRKSSQLAKHENFRVNLIEAYDQPWKRQLEGTVGGYWGLFNSERRELKYPPGECHQQFPALEMADGCRLPAQPDRVRLGLG